MITPLDIQNKEFSRAVRGYNQEEVDLFLDEIMADYTKEPDQINIDIENVAYADEEEKKILPEDPELKDADSSDGLTEEKVEKYSEVINMLGDFEDEN